jgi:hypothetical protein
LELIFLPRRLKCFNLQAVFPPIIREKSQKEVKIFILQVVLASDNKWLYSPDERGGSIYSSSLSLPRRHSDLPSIPEDNPKPDLFVLIVFPLRTNEDRYGKVWQETDPDKATISPSSLGRLS